MRYRWFTVHHHQRQHCYGCPSSPRMNSKLDFNCRKHVPLHNYGPMPRHSADRLWNNCNYATTTYYLEEKKRQIVWLLNCLEVLFFWSLGIVLSWAPFSFSYILVFSVSNCSQREHSVVELHMELGAGKLSSFLSFREIGGNLELLVH